LAETSRNSFRVILANVHSPLFWHSLEVAIILDKFLLHDFLCVSGRECFRFLVIRGEVYFAKDSSNGLFSKPEALLRLLPTRGPQPHRPDILLEHIGEPRTPEPPLIRTAHGVTGLALFAPAQVVAFVLPLVAFGQVRVRVEPEVETRVFPVFRREEVVLGPGTDGRAVGGSGVAGRDQRGRGVAQERGRILSFVA